MRELNKENYEQALRTLSSMVDELEAKDKIIRSLALKVEVLCEVIVRADVNINDYITIDDIVNGI